MTALPRLNRQYHNFFFRPGITFNGADQQADKALKRTGDPG
jgi:hypothetical protein